MTSITSKTQNMFSDIPTVCCKGPVDTGFCVCTKKEMAIRRYASGADLRPMTEEERKLLIEEADWFGEGYYSKEELTQMNDQDLADAVLTAWNEYVKTHW